MKTMINTITVILQWVFFVFICPVYLFRLRFLEFESFSTFGNNVVDCLLIKLSGLN